MSDGSVDSTLGRSDPTVADIIKREKDRQRLGPELIASENYTSAAVLEAMGSILTNKYAVGYPGKRYYGGCYVVDDAETLAIDRAKELFGAEHANVQPHSGSQANAAVYEAVLERGDTVLAMNLDHGGHLTHGSPVNFSGKHFAIVPYGVAERDECIDYDQVRALALEHRPKMIQCGATAYSRVIDFEKFREIADEVDAVLFADIAHIAGLVASGVHPSPVGLAQIVTTTTHKTLRGPRGGLILCDAQWQKKIDSAIFPGMQGGPLMHVIAAKAVGLLEALQPDFTEYSAQVIANASALGEGLIGHGFYLVSGGTDNHLLLVDLRPSHDELTGKEAERALEEAGITVNKNTVPGETRSPFVTSGLRIGTPALTSRGMQEAEMRRIADWIALVLGDLTDEAGIAAVRGEVRELCASFPLYAELATIA